MFPGWEKYDLFSSCSRYFPGFQLFYLWLGTSGDYNLARQGWWGWSIVLIWYINVRWYKWNPPNKHRPRESLKIRRVGGDLNLGLMQMMHFYLEKPGEAQTAIETSWSCLPVMVAGIVGQLQAANETNPSSCQSGSYLCKEYPATRQFWPTWEGCGFIANLFECSWLSNTILPYPA